MSEYYKPKKESGDAYVSATHEFFDYIALKLEQLPISWRQYSLNPIFEAASKIDMLVTQANAVYANKSALSEEDFCKALIDRVNLSQEALRMFDWFDLSFERLMRKRDLLHSETAEMRKILQHICEEHNSEKYNLSEVEVKLILKEDGFEYRTLDGHVKSRLSFSDRNIGRILFLENEAKSAIQKRVSKDRNILRSLSKAS